MEYFGVDEVMFAYTVFDKKNGNKKIIPKEHIKRTRKEVKQVISDAVGILDEAELTGEYKPQKNRLCFFCPLKPTCPLYNKQTESLNI